MKELLETIKIENGQIKNINWHNIRCNKSRKELFGEREYLNLKKFIKAPQKGVYRCRILYDKEIKSIEYIPYSPKKIDILKVIQSDIDYTHKYSDREELNGLLIDGYDEIIIEKDGLLTDTTIANIAFYNGQRWITPKRPLLEGTTRARLLHEKFLSVENIKSNHISDYSHFALMNAMIGFQIYKSTHINL